MQKSAEEQRACRTDTELAANATWGSASPNSMMLAGLQQFYILLLQRGRDEGLALEQIVK